jgi:hypothetical protein
MLSTPPPRTLLDASRPSPLQPAAVSATLPMPQWEHAALAHIFAVSLVAHAPRLVFLPGVADECAARIDARYKMRNNK